MIRTVLAPNASALTLDGTRTYLVGRTRVAVIDPGPRSRPHLDAVVNEVGDGVVVAILLTHRHPDHAAGAAKLSRLVRAPVLAAAAGRVAVAPSDRGVPATAVPASGVPRANVPDNDGPPAAGLLADAPPPEGSPVATVSPPEVLAEGTRIATDAGELIALATPGHTPDHFAFHLPTAGAVFVGDLMLGGMETSLVAAPEGDLGAYLASLERVRDLGARVLYPSHGPPFDDPSAALDTYLRHRRDRERQVLDALRGGARSVGSVVEAVYGPDLAPALAFAARGAVKAYLKHLVATGQARREGVRRWVVV
jgi:hydroxyacylglutathione hydrolase